MTTAEKYVTGAYLIVFLAVLVYVVIIALKLARLERELDDLARRARERRRVQTAEPREEVRVG